MASTLKPILTKGQAPLETDVRLNREHGPPRRNLPTRGLEAISKTALTAIQGLHILDEAHGRATAYHAAFVSSQLSSPRLRSSN